MKKPYKVIELLDSINQERKITNVDQARWLSRFNYHNPDCLRIVHNENNESPDGAYFKAELTGVGRQYLRELKHEIFGVSKEIHIL